MKRLILVVVIVLIGAFMAIKTVEPINCVVSKDNPYDKLPMVCKVVLKNLN